MAKVYCGKCRKAITKRNPSHAGGGSLSWDGKWSEWRICVKCQPPLTAEKLQEFMTAIYQVAP